MARKLQKKSGNVFVKISFIDKLIKRCNFIPYNIKSECIRVFMAKFVPCDVAHLLVLGFKKGHFDPLDIIFLPEITYSETCWFLLGFLCLDNEGFDLNLV